MAQAPSLQQKTMFHSYFHVNLFEFYHPIFGFDIIGFDDHAQQRWGYIEDGKTSLNDFITQKFGEGASKLISELISQ